MGLRAAELVGLVVVFASVLAVGGGCGGTGVGRNAPAGPAVVPTVSIPSEAYLGESVGLSEAEGTCVGRGLAAKGFPDRYFYDAPGESERLEVIAVMSSGVRGTSGGAEPGP